MIKCTTCGNKIEGACYNPPGGPYCRTCYEEKKTNNVRKTMESIRAKAIDFLREKNLWDWIEARGGMQVGKEELLTLLIEFRIKRKPFEL